MRYALLMTPREPAIGREAARSGRLEVTRVRAPRREGTRRQVTVPEDLWNAAERYAADHSTTPNDALIRFAAEAARRYERQQEIAARALAARSAILEMTPPMDTEGFLSPEEAAEAAQTLRREG